MRWTPDPGALALSFAPLFTALVTLFFTLMSPAPVLAETTYISDKIPVEVYSDTMQSGTLVTTLESGAVVEITETAGEYSKIRTLDGKEGWVKSNFVSNDRPVRAKYLQLVAKHKELQDEMEQLQAQLKSMPDADKVKATSDKMRKDLAQAKNTIAALEKQLKEKTDAFSDIEKQLQTLKSQTPDPAKPGMTTALSAQAAPESASQDPADPTSAALSPAQSPALPRQGFTLDYPIAVKWTLAASLLGIILGSYLGYSWLDSKIRRRHGGVRIR